MRAVCWISHLLVVALCATSKVEAEVADDGRFTMQVVGNCRRDFGDEYGLTQVREIRHRRRCEIRIGISQRASHPTAMIGTRLRLVAVTRVRANWNTGRHVKLTTALIERTGSTILHFRWNVRMCWFIVQESSIGSPWREIGWLETLRALNTDECDCAGEPCT